jgi:hypothetical protein
VQLGAWRHLVHDLGDRRPVLDGDRSVERARAAEVGPPDGAGQLPLGLTLCEPAEAAVDDRDLDAAPRVAGRVPAGRSGDRDALAADRIELGPYGLARKPDGFARAERRQAFGREARLEQSAERRLDLSAGGTDGGCCGVAVACVDLDAHASTGDLRQRRRETWSLRQRERDPRSLLGLQRLRRRSSERPRREREHESSCKQERSAAQPTPHLSPSPRKTPWFKR